MRERPGRRYQHPQGAEAEAQPGSHGLVLRNLLGIARKREMDQVENDALLEAQSRYLERIGSETRFTAALLREMHRDWLGGIYEWAGQYRTVELQKGDFTWPPAFRVADNMAAFDAGPLRDCTPCRPAPLPEVARRIAVVHAELLLIHPFREGNGRLARWLAGLMALQAGFPTPQYRFEGRGSVAEGARYLAAVKRGYLGECELLAAFFTETILRRLPDTARPLDALTTVQDPPRDEG